MWKLATIVGTVVLSVTVGCMATPADSNVEAPRDNVKVFVGAVSQMEASDRDAFVEERTALLLEQSETAPQAQQTALIIFNRYLTAAEADAVVASLGDCQVHQIFLGIPQEDGRTIIGKAGSETVSEQVAKYFDQMIAEEEDDDMKQEFLRYKNHSKVFAITVTATNKAIASVTQMDVVDFVDLYLYPQAEQTAKKKKVPVSYVALPEKPDGSH